MRKRIVEARSNSCETFHIVFIVQRIEYQIIIELLEQGKVSCSRVGSSKNIVHSFNITIPQKSLDEISKIIERDEMIEMYVSDRKVLYVFDNNIIQTRLIDGTFPDTNRLIPDAFDYELDLDAHYLLNAIDRVSLLTNEQNNIIKLDMSDEKVVLSSYMQEIGSVEEILDKSFYKGTPISISFSSKYATDAIRAFNEPKIKILFTGEMKPFIIKDFEKDDVIQLVLPVRTF